MTTSRSLGSRLPPLSASARPLSASAQKVEDALAARGLGGRVRELTEATRTAADAAAALGCEVAQICKSLVFRTRVTDRFVLVITSGANRANEEKVAREIGEPIGKADAAFVRARTGFVIGGVPPVGHLDPPLILIDQDLLRFREIWAAAGTPNSIFPLSPGELVQVTGAKVCEVA